jgi:catechol 2,3-dioxygenase-like lactoylglutathione lyase family enzyme
MDGERIIIQSHRWDTADDHPHMGNPDSKPYGNGAVLWFQIDDFDAAVQRVTDRQVEILEGPQVNPNANHREIWVRDPDGYVVVLAGAYGEIGAVEN